MLWIMSPRHFWPKGRARQLTGFVLCCLVIFSVVLLSTCGQIVLAAHSGSVFRSVKVGTAAVELVCDDKMVIAGGIHPRYVQGQEGQLRATAFVVEPEPGEKVVLVSCDVLIVTQDLLRPILESLEARYGISRGAVLIAATHTHHAPSTVRVHGYGREEAFCQQLQKAILTAVENALGSMEPAIPIFAMSVESTIGQNSRLLLSDGTIFWIGRRDDAVRPTGPVDVDLPVLAFRRQDGSLKGFFFAHAVHAIGTVRGNVRSPTFYGLAVQQLEAELGGIGAYFPGPSGSTHRLDTPPAVAQERIVAALKRALEEANVQPLTPLRCARKEFRFRIRHFDEEAEAKAVEYYCRKRAGTAADSIIEVFTNMRRELAPLQGQERTTEIQAIRMGDICFVGIPAELFPSLGLQMRKRSPFRYTYVIQLANDWIGYVPDAEAFNFGGYQVWTGFHSYVAKGTGEEMVEAVVALLEELAEK